jgi:hypothetical protein
MSEEFFLQDMAADDAAPVPLRRESMALLQRLVRKRMSDQYAERKLYAVRLLDAGGNELYRWSWFAEDGRRQRIKKWQARNRDQRGAIKSV